MMMTYNSYNRPLTEAEKVKRCQELVRKDNVSANEEERLKKLFEQTLKQMKRIA